MATHTHEQHANDNFPVIGHGRHHYSRVNSTQTHSWSCTVTYINTDIQTVGIYRYVPLVLVLDRWIYLLALGGHIGLMVDEVKGHGQEPAAVCVALRVLSVCIGGPLDVWGSAVHGSLGL